MSFNAKALGAFKKLGAVALITATLAVCFTACKQTSGGGGGGKPTPTPTPKPKHAITFSVDGTTPNGTLKAKADGVPETSTSPINVEEGKTVTFTATPSANYKVKEWKVGDTVVTGNNSNTYSHKVTKACTVKVSFEANSNPPNPPTQQGTAILTLNPNKLKIKVKAKTADGSAITVEGCTVPTLASDKETKLNAKGTKVILKGNITELDVHGIYNNRQPLTALDVSGLTSLQELYCWANQLTELNVQGLTALQKLYCWINQLTELNVQGLTSLQELDCSLNQLPELNVQGLTALQKLECYGNQIKAQAMTKLLKGLPQRKAGDGAFAFLYTEKTDVTEGNCKDYSTPEDLKKALDEAKKRNWTLKKVDVNGSPEDI